MRIRRFAEKFSIWHEPALLHSFPVVENMSVSSSRSGFRALFGRKSDRNPATDLSGRRTEAAEQPSYQPTDIVRVSIVLEQRPTIQASFSASRLAKNEEAMAYSRKLLAAQEELAQTISRTVLGGEKLDVIWNLTLTGTVDFCLAFRADHVDTSLPDCSDEDIQNISIRIQITCLCLYAVRHPGLFVVRKSVISVRWLSE